MEVKLRSSLCLKHSIAALLETIEPKKAAAVVRLTTSLETIVLSQNNVDNLAIPEAFDSCFAGENRAK